MSLPFKSVHGRLGLLQNRWNVSADHRTHLHLRHAQTAVVQTHGVDVLLLFLWLQWLRDALQVGHRC